LNAANSQQSSTNPTLLSSPGSPKRNVAISSQKLSDFKAALDSQESISKAAANSQQNTASAVFELKQFLGNASQRDSILPNLNGFATGFQSSLEEALGPILASLAKEAGKVVHSKLCEKYPKLSKRKGLADKCVEEASSYLSSFDLSVTKDVGKDLRKGFHNVMIMLLRALRGAIDAIIGMVKRFLRSCLWCCIKCCFDPYKKMKGIAMECFISLTDFLKDTMKKNFQALKVPDVVTGIISFEASPDEKVEPLVELVDTE